MKELGYCAGLFWGFGSNKLEGNQCTSFFKLLEAIFATSAASWNESSFHASSNIVRRSCIVYADASGLEEDNYCLVLITSFI